MTLLNTRRWIAATMLAAASVLAGCAHPMNLSPDASQLTSASGTAKIAKKVGLHISEADKALEVTSPGGGGDKLSYFPYRDLETGIYTVLGQQFAGVSSVVGPADPKVTTEGLSFIVSPQISTTSYSGSLVTWPPTLFTVELVCKVSDAQGKLIAEVRTQGEGRAEFDEFKSNLSLSAQRASADALKKLGLALAQHPALSR